MSWEVALVLATLIGQGVAMVARFIPWIPNTLVPKIALGTNFLANLVLVAQKFLESASLTLPGVAWYDISGTVSQAGLFSSLKGIGVVLASALIAYAQVALQRLVHEKGVKPVINAGNSGVF